MMKKYIYILLLAALAVSCVKGGSYSRTYPSLATFEYYDVTFGQDSLWVNTADGVGIPWGAVMFMHKLDGKEFLGGFRLSAQKGGGSSEGNNLYRVMSDGGSYGSLSYLVFYDNPSEEDMPEHDFKFFNTAHGSCSVAGCYINNTVEVADSVLANFSEKDRLVITATGYLGSTETGKAEFVLADKDSLVKAWTPFDLSDLGSVEYIDFKVTSTHEDVPAYFCLDDFLMSISESY